MGKKGDAIPDSVLKRHQELKEKGTINQFDYEQKIYYDDRQFSVKLPREMMNYFHFKKGDSLRFIIDTSEKGEPTLKLEYVHKK